MSNITTTNRPLATIEAATNPKPYNVVIASANTEVAQVLSPNVKRLAIWCEGSAKVEYYFTSGSVVTLKIPRGGFRVIEGINFSGIIYLKTSEGSQVVDLEEWT